MFNKTVQNKTTCVYLLGSGLCLLLSVLIRRSIKKLPDRSIALLAYTEVVPESQWNLAPLSSKCCGLTELRVAR